jgi:flavin reductase (DIM6/NTAB) family NADH-FMN oxidoreductase RutF
MRKDLGKQPAVFPMPVLMVTAYDENGTVQVMNAAWGMICGMDKIALFYSTGSRHDQSNPKDEGVYGKPR